MTNRRQHRVIQVAYLGGIPPRVDLQCKSLKKFGYSVGAVAHASEQSLGGTHLNDVVRVHTPIRNRLLKTKVPKTMRVTIGHLEYIFRVAHNLARKVTAGDIVQLSHPFLLTLVPLLKSKKVRIYYDAFEFYTLTLPELGLPGRAFSWLSGSLENRYVPVINGVLCVSSRDNWLKQRLKSLNPNTQEIWNLPSLEYSTDDKLSSEIRQRFFGKELIVYAGGLKPQKGLANFPDIVSRVVRKCATAHFLVIGKIKVHGDAQTWLIREGLDQHCTYIPWLSFNALYTYLVEASVGLILAVPTGSHLLLGPGGGRKLFTYMAAGLPVVAPIHSTSWDLVTTEKIGVQVDTTRAKDVAKGVLALLEQSQLRKEMADRAKYLFLEKYNWECHESKYIKLLAASV
jgi:glycosyltransferase involved in cell wall biosynthesis